MRSPVGQFAVQKGHHYMTVVIDLETGEILHAQEGKSAASVKVFLEKLKREAKIKAIAVDMSPAYQGAFEEVF